MKLRNLFFVLVAGVVFSACNNDEGESGLENQEDASTYLNLSIKLPGSNKTKALPEDYNPDGTYEGLDRIETLDIYMMAGNGVIEAKRFMRADLSTDGAVVTPNQPFRTTSGSKTIYVVLNNPSELGTTITKEDELINISGLAKVVTVNGVNQDVITMTGKKENVFIQPDISAQEVTGGINKIAVEVTRLASRVIVTTEAASEITATGGDVIGSLSNITYSVAQGTKKVYWIGQEDYITYGSEYIPILGGYVGQADTYYDYSDLYEPETVPAKPTAGDGYKSMKGKFLFENTHKEGDVKSSEYKKGNTAYVLIRAKFTPRAEVIEDGGPLVNGTFYVGQSNGKIYSTIQAAQTAVRNQKVATYQEGKMIYYAWLNPDDIIKPLNSPVQRNNIYHINITGFKKLGYTWNPLFPEDPDGTNLENPDPKPGGPEEPEIPIDPIDPLSPEETYMTVEVTTLDWLVHSYDIDL